MSDDLDKYKHSKRLLKNEAAIIKQVSIAKSHGVSSPVPGKREKTRAMTCGRSTCAMCGNPRKFFGDRTIQEQRMYQSTCDGNCGSGCDCE